CPHGLGGQFGLAYSVTAMPRYSGLGVGRISVMNPTIIPTRPSSAKSNRNICFPAGRLGPGAPFWGPAAARGAVPRQFGFWRLSAMRNLGEVGPRVTKPAARSIGLRVWNRSRDQVILRRRHVQIEVDPVTGLPDFIHRLEFEREDRVPRLVAHHPEPG